MSGNLLLTPNQLAQVLDVSRYTVDMLVKRGEIPYTQGLPASGAVRFDLALVSKWLENDPLVSFNKETQLVQVRKNFAERFPSAMKNLKIIDNAISTQKKGKGYGLVKVPSKKHGFLFYVRYCLNGKMLSSKWNTHTNNREEAERFALANRDRLIAKYFRRKKDKANTEKQKLFFPIFSQYYEKDSPYLKIEAARESRLCEKSRSIYYNFLNNVFLPYLRERGVKTFEGVTPPLLADFQDRLLMKGNKGVTINRYFCAIRSVFSYCVMKGIAKRNPLARVKSLKEKGGGVRGCFELEKMNGVFDREWEDKISYLLCLIIYTTGMRNSEIVRLRPKDIINRGGVYFVNIGRSKTESGKRVIPLHPFVYQKIAEYIKENNMREEGFIFSKKGYNQSMPYKRAARVLGERLGYTEKELTAMRITFYSGRHYWKTAMSAEGLGSDVEELFMGHKTSGDVAARYNHKDKRGLERILASAGDIFAILDKILFSL